ncbi:MAG: ABC transporter permease [Anaerolineaceae bacterium]|nr:ABC transporter permease [Anaerolineaceae bacterium]
MANAVLVRKLEGVSPTRQRWMGVVEIGMAVLILIFFTLKVQPGSTSTFNMTPGGITRGVAGDWVVPALGTLIFLTVVAFLLGVYQFVRGFGKWTNGVLGIIVAFFVFGFLVWASAGKSLNLSGMLSAAVLLGVPIILGAFSGVISERAGVVNIAIEGLMLMAAMVGALVGSVTQSIWWGLLGAIVSSVLLALVHGVLSIKYKINQIISGTVINIFSTGMTSYLSSKFMQTYQNLNNPPIFPRIPIPLLADIPIIGPLFFNTNIFVYLTFILLIVIQVALFSTRWGLRLRSVGEHPKAADTLGINVIRTRYVAVILSGVVAGIGGAFFTLGSVGRFDEMMTAGKGFIGLAAMIFGNWTPIGAFLAGLMFGFADSVATKLSILGTGIPTQFMAMAPYLTTMIVLAGLVGRGQVPAADGEPYTKE